MTGTLPFLQLPIASVRYIAISATIQNIQDIAQWLAVPQDGLFVFGEELRPVKLSTVVKGYATGKIDFLFEGNLNGHLSGSPPASVAPFAAAFCKMLQLRMFHVLCWAGFSFSILG
jgi:hypothetical protein